MEAGTEPVAEPAPKLSRIHRMREKAHRMPGGRQAWRIGVAVLGFVVVVIGIILLPLPGPGWVIIFFGLGIWATEFEWAQRLLNYAKSQVMRWTSWVMNEPIWVRGVIGLACLAIVAGALYLAWIITH